MCECHICSNSINSSTLSSLNSIRLFMLTLWLRFIFYSLLRGGIIYHTRALSLMIKMGDKMNAQRKIIIKKLSFSDQKIKCFSNKTVLLHFIRYPMIHSIHWAYNINDKSTKLFYGHNFFFSLSLHLHFLLEFFIDCCLYRNQIKITRKFIHFWKLNKQKRNR